MAKYNTWKVKGTLRGQPWETIVNGPQQNSDDVLALLADTLPQHILAQLVVRSVQPAEPPPPVAPIKLQITPDDPPPDEALAMSPAAPLSEGAQQLAAVALSKQLRRKQAQQQEQQEPAAT